MHGEIKCLLLEEAKAAKLFHTENKDFIKRLRAFFLLLILKGAGRRVSYGSTCQSDYMRRLLRGNEGIA
jgi:hypothetical protein